MVRKTSDRNDPGALTAENLARLENSETTGADRAQSIFSGISGISRASSAPPHKLLWAAIDRNSVDRVKELISSEPSIGEVPDIKNGHTALHRAVHRNKLEIVKVLLDYVENSDVVDNRGFTPLHVAVQKNYVPIARVLLVKYDNVNQQTVKGNTAMHYSCDAGNLPLVQMLLESGADLEIKNNLGYSSIDIIKTKLRQASPAVRDEFQRLIDTTNSNNRRLFAAVSRGLENEVVRAIDSGADVGAFNSTGETVLHVACRRGGKFCIVEFLLQRGANPNQMSSEGKRPLDIAHAQKPRAIRIIELLMLFDYLMADFMSFQAAQKVYFDYIRPVHGDVPKILTHMKNLANRQPGRPQSPALGIAASGMSGKENGYPASPLSKENDHSKTNGASDASPIAPPSKSKDECSIM
eukprot:Clim_evm9s172 gene=Clim_evmTU9s172